MKSTILLLSIATLASCLTNPSITQAEEPAGEPAVADTADAEFTDLFNGTNLTGWKNPYDWGDADVVDGEIQLLADKKFFLVYDQVFGDFILEVDIHLPEGKANSGVMFRAHVEENKVFGYQAECDGSDRRWSGGLYDEGRRGWIWPSHPDRSKAHFLGHSEVSLAHMAKPEVSGALKRDGWNTYRITAKGTHIQIEVNGVLVTDFHDDLDSEGYIAIQHHGEKGQTYRFRNIRIKELK